MDFGISLLKLQDSVLHETTSTFSLEMARVSSYLASIMIAQEHFKLLDSFFIAHYINTNNIILIQNFI